MKTQIKKFDYEKYQERYSTIFSGLKILGLRNIVIDGLINNNSFKLSKHDFEIRFDNLPLDLFLYQDWTNEFKGYSAHVKLGNFFSAIANIINQKK